MTLRAPFVPAPCAEFPNDNPALHHGASWVCLAPLGPLRAVVRPTPVQRAQELQEHPAPRGATQEPPALSKQSAVVPEVAESTPVAPAAEDESDAAELAFLDVMRRRLLWPADLADVVEAWLRPRAAAPVSPPAGRRPQTRPVSPPAGRRPQTRPVSPPAGRRPQTRPKDVLEALLASAMDARLRWSPELCEVMELVMADAERDESLDDGAPAAVLTSPPSEASEGRGGTERPLPAEGRASVAHPGPPDGFLAFVRALVDVALNSGATRAAAVIPILFEVGWFDASALDAETAESLQKRGVIDRRGGAFTVTEEFALTAAAWRDVLRGQSEDLEACGTSTLDSWAADLLRALRVAADDGRDVRRELRRRGVAAFGMLLAA